MSTDVWKAFEENQLTHSAAHYLMTIHDLLEEQGYARVTDIAKRLNITRGSCSISLKPLKKRGLVVEDDNKFLQLSPEGARLAEMVRHNDLLLERLLHEVLGVDKDQAEIDACKLEHLISIKTSMALHGFIQFIESDHRIVKEFLAELRGRQVSPCPPDQSGCEACQTVCIYDNDEAE